MKVLSNSNLGNIACNALAAVLIAAASVMMLMPSKAFAQSAATATEVVTSAEVVSEEADKSLSKEEIIKFVTGNSIQYPSAAGLGTCHMDFFAKEEGKLDFYCNRAYEKGSWEIVENAKGQAVMVRTFVFKFSKEIKNVFYKDSEGKIFIKLVKDKKSYLTSKPL